MAITRYRLIEIIASLFILLFVYTATDKFIHHDRFQIAISKSPLPAFSNSIIVWGLPITEFFIASLLFVPSLRKKGLITAFLLMVLFTFYVAYMILFSANLSCSCGGVISQMSWKQHLVFNIIFILLAGTGIWLSKQTKDFIAINRSSRIPV